jgi:hypothetical protein
LSGKVKKQLGEVPEKWTHEANKENSHGYFGAQFNL